MLWLKYILYKNELLSNLTDGISDIYDYYPNYIIEPFYKSGYIEENKNFAWIFSQDGVEEFKTPEDMKNWHKNY